MDIPQEQNYTVSTQVYEGPLDLLLQLIERVELDITKLALAQVTDQFLAYLKRIQEINVHEVAEFLIIATRLMQIKSEALLPRPPVREPGELDPGDVLVQQLIVYKRYKELSNILKERESLGLHTYLRLTRPPKVAGKLDLTGIELEDLLSAARHVFSTKGSDQSLGDVVTIPKITMHDKIRFITERLRKLEHVTFHNLLGSAPSRLDVVVTFLAVLELVKIYRVKAIQANMFGEIELRRDAQWDDGEEISFALMD
jgi:segregation and condensation protein A